MSKNELQSASSLKELSKKEELSNEIAEFKAAIDSNPNDVENRVKLAVVLTEQGESDSAIAHLEDAIRINPNYADAYYQLGCILDSEKNELEAAIVKYQEAIRLKPNEAAYHSILAACFEQQGNFTEAISEYEKAIHFNPNDANSYLRLGSIMLDLNQKDQAKAAFFQSQELFKVQNKSKGVELVDMFLERLN